MGSANGKMTESATLAGDRCGYRGSRTGKREPNILKIAGGMTNMGIIWYILGLISGGILTAVASCTIVSGRISREEEMRELAEKREECREDGS